MASYSACLGQGSYVDRDGAYGSPGRMRESKGVEDFDGAKERRKKAREVRYYLLTGSQANGARRSLGWYYLLDSNGKK